MIVWEPVFWLVIPPRQQVVDPVDLVIGNATENISQLREFVCSLEAFVVSPRQDQNENAASDQGDAGDFIL
jgi:hypothetical protein